MANIVVVGTQWGDEGKGKVVDILAARFDAVARYQGGNNAGHTVVVGQEKVVLHLVPSGILRMGKICVLGNGVVIDLPDLVHEMDQLARLNVQIAENFFISTRAHLVLPYHKILDAEKERQRGKGRLGTTGRGIGPAYVDKMARMGIPIGELAYPDLFREKLADNLAEKRAQYPASPEIAELDAEKITTEQLTHFARVKDFLVESSLVLTSMMREGKSILFEGAQGTLLDVDLGTYPYVTSSSAVAGGACIGTGVGPTQIDGTLGVAKAYTTRVGEGPFPTELTDRLGERIRERGEEYGATTGRPRRCGWFDSVLVRYAIRVNDLSALALTKLDVLDECDTVKICTAYRYRGATLTELPSASHVLAECEPLYEELPGWKESTVGLLTDEALPSACQKYIRRLEESVGIPVALISTGPRRDQTILRDTPLLHCFRLLSPSPSQTVVDR